MSDPIWNVSTVVVDLIAAPTAEAAKAVLSTRLRRAGFGELGEGSQSAIESEPIDPNLETVIRAEASADRS